MPLNPGDKRIGVTYNPATGYITPDVPLQKESDPSHVHELARILDIIGEHAYVGVVWVGQMLEESYFPDESNSPIAGYLSAPFNTLNEGYVAACSRYGTPGSGAKVAVICVEANTAEVQSVQLCSSYVDIYGIGSNRISGAPGLPIFTSCAASGMTVEGLEFIANSAPVLAVSATEPLTDGMTFEKCSFTNIGPSPSAPEGLLDIRSPLSDAIVLEDCYASLNNRPLLYFDPDENDYPLVLDIQGSLIEIESGVGTVFLGLGYLGVRLYNCDLVACADNGSLFSCYSNGGRTYTDITSLRIRSDDITKVFTLKLIDNARYNEIHWEDITSDLYCILNVSAFVDATLSGEIRVSRFFRLTLNSATLTLANFRIANSVGDFAFTVVAVTSSVEFINLRTTSFLTSVSDPTALITSSGAVAPKVLSCKLSYRLFYATGGTGVFCGLVVGGNSFGISRVACLGNPVRQCVIRNHSLGKQYFYTNNTVSSIFYPDLKLAGVTPNDVNYPILLEGVESQGIIDTEVPDLTQIPNRYAYISNSTFTAHGEIDQPFFPSIPAALNTGADQRIFISAGGRFPREETDIRDLGLRSTTYVQRIANRFGPLYLGNSSQSTIIEGNSFSVSNPRALREALNVNYTTLYCRMPGGWTYIDLTNPKFDSWSVFNMTAEAGLDHDHLSEVSANLPMVYSYIGNNTLRFSIPAPALDVDHLDFVVTALNAPEDAAVPQPVTSLDVTQAGKIPIPLGVTAINIPFTPAFTTVPIVVTDVLVPSGAPDVQIEVNADSINNLGFTVLLSAGPLSVDGYFISYIAASTN